MSVKRLITGVRMRRGVRAPWRVAVPLTFLACVCPLAVAAGASAATSVSNLSVTAVPATAGSVRVVYEASFKATSALSSKDVIELMALSGTTFGSGLYYSNNYLVTDGSRGEFASAQVDPGGLGNNVANVQVPIAVAAGDTVHVTAFGVSNPSMTTSGDFFVSTSTDATLVGKALTIGAPTAISSASVSTDDPVAGEGAKVVVAFKASGALSDGESGNHCCGSPGYIRLDAPTGTEFAPGYDTVSAGAASSEEASSEVDPEGLGNNVVDVAIPRGVPVAAGEAVQVSLHLYNPAAASETTQFAISTSSDVIPVSEAFPVSAGSLPELGRCLAVTASGEGKASTANGAYDNKGCTKTSQDGTGKYEWRALGPAKHFSSVTGKTTLESAGLAKLTCAAGSGSGEYTGARTERMMLTFTGCELSTPKTACQSEGAAAGEVRSLPLEGELGFINAHKPEVGWDISPASGSGDYLATFNCGGTEVSVGGSVISQVTPLEKMRTDFTTKYQGSKAPERLEGEPADTLTLTIAGESKAAALTATSTIEDQEAVEVKAAS